MVKVSRLTNVDISEAVGGDRFEIDRQGLWNILYAALANTKYDDGYYVKMNIDVREGIKKGEISSGFDHFVKFGFLEGRRGWRLRVDERFYLAEYEDVRKSIDNGNFNTGQDHFDAIGEVEGRLPYKGFSYFGPIKRHSGLFSKP